MNPLSAWTFYRRHKRRAMLLLGLIALVTIGLYLLAALSWAMFVEPMRSNHMFLSKFSIVLPPGIEDELDASVAAQIRANPDVARVIPASGMQIALPEVMGGGADWFHLLSLMEEDVPYVMEKCGATLKEGRPVQPRTNGIMLSEQVAANLGLQVGDTIQDSINPELYGNIVDPLAVVGIMESDVRLGIISHEFSSSHELYRRFPLRFLVVAQEGREAAVDSFLRNEIRAAGVGVQTFQWLTEWMASEYRATYSLLIPIIAIVAIVITVVIGVINRIAFTRRLPEFGILHAAGHSKRWLTRRLTMETGVLACTGWMVGIGLSWLILYVLKLALFAPRGHDLSAIALAPAALIIPIPISVIGFTLISVGRIFSQLDAVAVVEQGELSLEENRHQTAPVSESSPKPLASWTFYKRHRRRAVLLIGAMGLMIMAVALVIFLLAVTYDAERAGLGNLSRMSIVGSLPGSSLGPAVTTQVRTHPAVERAIRVAPRHKILTIMIPPLGGGADASPYGVYAEDMAYLVELYGLELKEGHLPRPRTNEMVISEVVAQNRDLKIGDVIGDPDHPAYPNAPRSLAEFVISGIFARPTAEDENWLAFVSLEFLESHEAYNIPDDVPRLIVVPKAGQKAALDDWLENELASDEVWVATYRRQVARAQQKTRSMILTIALLESVIAIVAAIALAVLNYIFVSQRQSEFGVLHALGYGRLRLVWRTVREAAFTTGAAWGLSAILCLIGLLYLQFRVFTPLGLKLNLLNLTPWLFTLPIPIAVLAVTSGTIARTLSKLDPVSIIEGR